MKTQHTPGPEHCPTCGCPCDVSGIGYSPTELYSNAPETAAERDRLKGINSELVQALEGIGTLHTTLSLLSNGAHVSPQGLQAAKQTIQGIYKAIEKAKQS